MWCSLLGRIEEQSIFHISFSISHLSSSETDPGTFIDNMLTIKQVETPEEVESTRQLFEEYVGSLGVSLCFQNYDKEVAELPGEYVPPSGRLYLASDDNQVVGCIALRKLEDEV